MSRVVVEICGLLFHPSTICNISLDFCMYCVKLSPLPLNFACTEEILKGAQSKSMETQHICRDTALQSATYKRIQDDVH